MCKVCGNDDKQCESIGKTDEVASPVDLLVSCPFCGEVPKHYNFGDAEYSEKVMCVNQDCHIKPMGYFETVDGMIKAWNKRGN